MSQDRIRQFNANMALRNPLGFGSLVWDGKTSAHTPYPWPFTKDGKANGQYTRRVKQQLLMELLDDLIGWMALSNRAKRQHNSQVQNRCNMQIEKLNQEIKELMQ
jgi:hypothetical protein